MSQDTRKKLLEGAQKCLVQEGFRKTSVKAIARYAGVNHGLVHHYFGSKEELLAALVILIRGKCCCAAHRRSFSFGF